MSETPDSTPLQPFPVTLRVVSWRQTQATGDHLVRGRATLLLVELGLQMHNVWILLRNDGKPSVHIARHAVRNPDGEKVWVATGEFTSPPAARRFSDAAWAAVIAAYPKVAPHPSMFRQAAA